MNRDPTDLPVQHFTLAGVEADPHLQTELSQRVPDRARTADCPHRPVEGGEEAVPGRVHLAPTEANEVPADQCVVALEDFPPLPVAELHRSFG
jgi:hypothetical protein